MRPPRRPPPATQLQDSEWYTLARHSFAWGVVGGQGWESNHGLRGHDATCFPLDHGDRCAPSAGAIGPRRRLPPPGRADTGPGRSRKSDLTRVKPAIYPPERPQARGRTWGLPPPAPAKHSRGQQVVYSSIPLAKLSFRAARAGGWCGTTYHELRCRARRPPPPGGLGPGPGRAPGTRQARAQKEAEPGN